MQNSNSTYHLHFGSSIDSPRKREGRSAIASFLSFDDLRPAVDSQSLLVFDDESERAEVASHLLH